MLICQDRLSGDFCIYIGLLPPTAQPTTGDHGARSNTLQGLSACLKKYIFPSDDPYWHLTQSVCYTGMCKSSPPYVAPFQRRLQYILMTTLYYLIDLYWHDAASVGIYNVMEWPADYEIWGRLCWWCSRWITTACRWIWVLYWVHHVVGYLWQVMMMVCVAVVVTSENCWLQIPAEFDAVETAVTDDWDGNWWLYCTFYACIVWKIADFCLV